MSETILVAGGIFNLLFVPFHLLFWRIFNWKEELPSLNQINQAVMQVLNLSLTFVFVIFGTVSLLFPEDMVGTGLGRAMTGMIAIFWVLRAVEQVLFFKLRNWVSWAFLLIFLTGSGAYTFVLL